MQCHSPSPFTILSTMRKNITATVAAASPPPYFVPGALDAQLCPLTNQAQRRSKCTNSNTQKCETVGSLSRDTWFVNNKQLLESQENSQKFTYRFNLRACIIQDLDSNRSYTKETLKKNSRLQRTMKLRPLQKMEELSSKHTDDKI